MKTYTRDGLAGELVCDQCRSPDLVPIEGAGRRYSCRNCWAEVEDVGWRSFPLEGGGHRDVLYTLPSAVATPEPPPGGEGEELGAESFGGNGHFSPRDSAVICWDAGEVRLSGSGEHTLQAVPDTRGDLLACVASATFPEI